MKRILSFGIALSVLFLFGCGLFGDQSDDKAVEKNITPDLPTTAETHLDTVRDLLDELEKQIPAEEKKDDSKGFELIPTVQAEEAAAEPVVVPALEASTAEDLVLAVVAELDAAMTSIEESGDTLPLSELSEVQLEASSVFNAAASEVSGQTAEVLTEIADEVVASNETVEALMSDIEEGEINGEIVTLELDPVLTEGVVEETAGKKKLNMQKFIEKRIEKAESTVQNILTKMTTAGISEEEQIEFSDAAESRIAKMKDVLASGDFQKGFRYGRDVMKEINLAQRALKNTNLAEKLEGMDIPAGIREKIRGLLEEGKSFEAEQKAAQAIHTARKEARIAIQAEKKTAMKELYAERKSIRDELKSGDLTSDEAREKLGELKKDQAVLRKEYKMKRQELIQTKKAEKADKKLEKINALSGDAKKEALEKFNEMQDKRTEKKEEIKTKIEEKREAIKTKIEEKKEANTEEESE